MAQQIIFHGPIGVRTEKDTFSWMYRHPSSFLPELNYEVRKLSVKDPFQAKIEHYFGSPISSLHTSRPPRMFTSGFICFIDRFQVKWAWWKWNRKWRMITGTLMCKQKENWSQIRGLFTWISNTNSYNNFGHTLKMKPKTFTHFAKLKVLHYIWSNLIGPVDNLVRNNSAL